MLQSVKNWQDRAALLKCLEGLDKVAAGELKQQDVLDYVELLKKDVNDGSHLVSFAASPLCDILFFFHQEQGKELDSVHGTWLQLKRDIENLLCVGYLGKEYGNLGEVRLLCRNLYLALDSAAE